MAPEVPPPPTIDEWLATQDEAVNKEYRRLRRRKKSALEIEPADTINIPKTAAEKDAVQRLARCKQQVTESIAGMIYSAAEARNEIRDFECVRRQVHAIENANAIAVAWFQSGTLIDAENHDVKLVQEIVDGKKVSRVVIDGQSALP